MPMIGFQFRSIQMMLMDLNMKVNLVKQSVGISLLLNQVLKLFMATMPNQKKNCVSKLKVRIGKIFWLRFQLKQVISSMCQVVPCMLLVQVSWFLKRNNLVIRPTVFMILTVKMIKVTCVNSILKNLSMSLISVSQPTVDQSQQK